MNKNDFKIAVFGLGHIGLPTAALFAKNGFNVIGVDINPDSINKINSGISPIQEPGLDELVKEITATTNNNTTNTTVTTTTTTSSSNNAVSKLKATVDGESATKDSNVIIVIVPTPVDSSKNADLGAVISACEVIAKGLKVNDLVIIESTVPPKTCDNVVIPILEKSGLKSGSDFGVVFTPERAIPNNTIYEMTHNARVIGGINQKSSDTAKFLYSNITSGEIIIVKNLITAEMVKLMENTYRDTNIALANEFAIVCENLNIDAIDAIEAANFHPRVNIHTPGPGVGGHCLSIDPYFIVELAKETNNPARLIETAREVNEYMPYHVCELTEKTLSECGKNINNATVGILGLSYKANVSDARETPSIPLINTLKSKGANLIVNDPYVDNHIFNSLGIKNSEIKDVLEADCVILITDHNDYKNITPDMIKNSIFICTRPIFDLDEFRNKGVIFKGVGRV
ncbi:MAG: nucleotide sugar dehydrogenase [Methanobacteriaceae archaeon]